MNERSSYQSGSLIRESRRTGPSVWIFRSRWLLCEKRHHQARGLAGVKTRAGIRETPARLHGSRNVRGR
jgi:hypothetical protein